ncbi:unnamed protein product [Allacma fusca]|uniref:Uncharacterized protein n=1 Tax=Allacma fusca TaxID=39272 RepID=A0A8J2KE30_9HEXA|nr:unnamed protein product [Allacma fusca]
MSTAPLCMICSSEANTKLVKNGEFRGALNLLWRLSEVDVKPGDNDHFDLCQACFVQLEEMKATHEAWLLVKEDLKKCRARLTDSVIVGLTKRKKKSMPFLGVHSKLQSVIGKNSLQSSSSQRQLTPQTITKELERMEVGDS